MNIKMKFPWTDYTAPHTRHEQAREDLAVAYCQMSFLIEKRFCDPASGTGPLSTSICAQTSQEGAYCPNIYTVFEGDCDEDDHCKGHLKCGKIKNGKGNCLELFPLSNFPTDAQCCYDPN